MGAALLGAGRGSLRISPTDPFSRLALGERGRSIGAVRGSTHIPFDRAPKVGGRVGNLKEQNCRRVLAVLLGSPSGLSQARVAELTNLSRSSVSSLLEELRSVLLHTEKANPAGNGRPIGLWRLDRSRCLSVGIDIGRTHVAALVTYVFGAQIAGPLRESTLGVLADPDGTLDLATGLVKRLFASQIDFDCADVAVVTVGLPGPVDRENGRMTDDAAPRWAEVDVRREVKKRWPEPGSPMQLAENKANLGALAEHRYGAGRRASSLLFIDWSSGIGGGLVLGGRVWRGHSGFAGEIGHLAIRPSKKQLGTLDLPLDAAAWPRCPHCRQRDCLDGLVGGLTIADAVDLPNLDAVAEAALDSERPQYDRAREVLAVAAELIGHAIGPALTLINPERIVIGGAVGRPGLASLLLGNLRCGIEQTSFARAAADVVLEVGALDRRAPVCGAARLGLDVCAVDRLIRLATPALVDSPATVEG